MADDNAGFSQYARKTVVAAVVTSSTAIATSLGVLLTSMNDASDSGSTVTGPEWVQFVIALVVGLGGAVGTAYGVYNAENRPQPARHAAGGGGPIGLAGRSQL